MGCAYMHEFPSGLVLTMAAWITTETDGDELIVVSSSVHKVAQERQGQATHNQTLPGIVGESSPYRGQGRGRFTRPHVCSCGDCFE